jgi:uncharacterized protein (DUF1800 family)
MPDENYAREVMQLFTIGLLRLNLDGTPVLVNGKPQETYGLADITGLARIFTGWDFDMAGGNATPDFLHRPMVQSQASRNGASPFLGSTVAAGAVAPRRSRPHSTSFMPIPTWRRSSAAS